MAWHAIVIRYCLAQPQQDETLTARLKDALRAMQTVLACTP